MQRKIDGKKRGMAKMKNYRLPMIALIPVLVLSLSGCESAPNDAARNNANAQASVPANTNSNPQPPLSTKVTPPNAPMFTLPMLNAFLADEAFTQDLKKRVQLTDDQIGQLKSLAEESRKQTTNQQPDNAASYARQYADERVRALL